MFSHLPDGVALTSAFLTGVATMVLGAGIWYGVKDAFKKYREANRQMAVRNK